MTRIVTDDHRIMHYLERRTGQQVSLPCMTIGLEREGEIVCSVVLNCYTGPDIELSLAGSLRDFRKSFMHFLHQYIFGQLGCVRVSMTIEKPEIAEMAKKLGARLEGVKRDAFGPGRPAFLMGVLSDEWVYK